MYEIISLLNECLFHSCCLSFPIVYFKRQQGHILYANLSHSSNFNVIQKVLLRMDLTYYSFVELIVKLFPVAFKGVTILTAGVNAKSCRKPLNSSDFPIDFSDTLNIVLCENTTREDSEYKVQIF